MRASLLTMLGAIAFTVMNASSAQAQLNTRDRLLIFHNYYQNQQNSRRILENQQSLRAGVRQFREVQNQQMATQDPIERYVRGVGPAAGDPRPLPRIYSGQGGSAQYFMRMNQFGTQFPAARPRF